jgi:hypothetical protein
MLAELDQVTGRAARWRFALGAARIALIPPRSSRLAGLVLAAGASAAALVIHVLLPEAGPVAAIALPGLPALSASIVLSRPEPPGRVSGAGRAAQVTAVAAIAACAVLAMREIALYPGPPGGGAVRYAGPVMTVMFAAELACYLLLVLRRPGLLGAGRHTGLAGLAAALATGWVAVLNQPPGGQSDSPVLPPVLLSVTAGVPLTAAALAALPGLMHHRGVSQSLRRGAGELIWGALFTGPAIFIAIVLTTSHAAIAAEATQPGFAAEAYQQGAASVPAWIAHDDLGGAMVLFTALSLGALPIFAAAQAIFPVARPHQPPEPLAPAARRPEA